MNHDICCEDLGLFMHIKGLRAHVCTGLSPLRMSQSLTSPSRLQCVESSAPVKTSDKARPFSG